MSSKSFKAAYLSWASWFFLADVCCPPVSGTVLEEAVPAGGLVGIGSVRDILVVRVGKRVRALRLFGPGLFSVPDGRLSKNVTDFLNLTSISFLPFSCNDFLSSEVNKLAKNSSPNL